MVKIVKFYVLYSHSETKTKKNPHIRIFNRYHKVVKGFTDGFMLCLVTQSCMTLCDPVNCSPPVSSLHGNSPGKNTGVGCHALLEEIFPTQGSNPGLLHCSWILYHLNHQGSPLFFLGAFLISLFSVTTESGESLGPGDTSVCGVGSSQVA